jgi:NitT/TauT family transport system substrate-binding protein
MEELINGLPKNISPPVIVQAPIGGQLALLESHSAQIAMVLEPGASLAEHEGYRVVYSSPKFYGPYAFTGVTTTKDVLDAAPKTALRFVTALEEAIVRANKDPQVAIRVGEKLFPNLPGDVVKRAVTRMLDEHTFPRHAVVDNAAWQRALATRVSVGDLKAMQATSVTVDNSFAEKAMAAEK